MHLVRRADDPSSAPLREPRVRVVRAAAEGGMVGALADWFAVTALFRHPMGVPVPHTALIPRKKDQLGAALKDFVQENAEVAFHFVADWLSKPDTKEVSDVPPGEGRIVEVDGKKVAVYREESGGVHALSPVCTHLGCQVNWKTAERSWDCPCHGGRFSPTGEVLNGPPIKCLESKKIR